MHYTRIYADSDGESHFEDVGLELKEVDFAPPAPPLLLSTFTEVTRCGFLSAPDNWVGDWHPVPQRQWMLMMKGEVEVLVSDGEIRYFGHGAVTFVEDTTGKGHATRVISGDELLVAVIQT